MGTDGSTGCRPKRRCTKASQSSHMPSAIHYVGYVEDDETPEMIMKKFEELEKVRRSQEHPVMLVKGGKDLIEINI
jgi:hypothetical protein